MNNNCTAENKCLSIARQDRVTAPSGMKPPQMLSKNSNRGYLRIPLSARLRRDMQYAVVLYDYSAKDYPPKKRNQSI
jgi:hypothetical protein